MRTLIVAALAVLVTTTGAQAQVRGVESGSAAAAAQVEAYRRRLEEAKEAWRTSKKITLLDKVSDEPQSQSGSLQVDELDNDSVGYLEYWQFEVLQVVGPSDLILMMNNPRIPPIWIAGYPTEGLVDGDQVRVVGLVKVDGTKSYTTVTGAKKTVRVVRLVPAKEMAAMAAAKKKAEEKAARAAEEKLFRTWSSPDGKFTVEAKFVDFASGKVHLERRDGVAIKVSPTQLSDADQEHFREILKSRREKNDR